MGLKIWSFKKHFAVSIVLVVVLLLVLGNNLEERYRMRQLEDSFSSVIEDRLMVEGYIYRLAQLVHEKQHFLEGLDCSTVDPSAAEQFFTADRPAIETLIADYETTYLTEAEAGLFTKLRQALDKMRRLEDQLVLALKTDGQASGVVPEMRSTIANSGVLLSGLSDIQLQEGKRLSEHTNRILLGRASSARLELVLLIILGIVAQFWILTAGGISRAMRPKDVQLN